MLAAWFHPLELSIPFSEFARLPRHPAYEYEYFDGRAVVTPRPRYRRATVDLTALPWSGLDLESIRLLDAGDWEHLPQLLASAFQHVPPFATLSDDLRLNAADDCVRNTRAGGDGSVLESACFVAIDPSQSARLDGAILITLIPDGDGAGAVRPHLTWIMVRPWHFAQGVGKGLLARAAAVLRELGYRELASTFLVGNERSALWHWRNGFRLVPDSHLVPPLRNSLP
jgi:GNAT superfamily N-acetyltransferase